MHTGKKKTNRAKKDQRAPDTNRNKDVAMSRMMSNPKPKRTAADY